ncbi:hypothetical protein CGZ80_19965 [Rhodopirellula sp. MGV]|nr:hypothetical protein CGZ80_19965 [Rhodopirellula sp. MGV]
MFCAVAIFISIATWQGRAQAGLSSENVIVVVNGDSTISRTIANHYVHLRKIPIDNVIVLEGIPKKTTMRLDEFRDQILNPVLKTIDERKLSPLARTIAYSADIPYAVKIGAHTNELPEGPVKKYQRPIASINGLTYFYRYVLSDSPAYLSFGSNQYARGKFSRHFSNPFTGDDKERFEEASKLDGENDNKASAEIWSALHKKHPEMPAVALNAAEAYSLSGDDAQAVAMIKAALKAGWWSSRYLRERSALSKYLDDPDLQKALPLMDDSPIVWQGPEAFSGSVGWAITGRRVGIKDGGTPYMMSCVLAVVHPNGSSTSEAVRILQRASESDHTFPKARFTFAGGAGVRAKTRFPVIADASVYLQELGYQTEIFRGVLPDGKDPIAGMMVGTANAPLANTPLDLVPGSIAENLTSSGAVFDSTSQIKCTEFLAAGAAMSSGTVTEPYSLPFKFPTPMMYGYYAQGLSAMESFYQSVQSPYQLLIVGDPLAQPFARAPDEVVEISMVQGEQKKIKLQRRSLKLDVPKTRTRSIELSINGKLMQTIPPTPNIELNWPDDASGIFDIRATLTGLDRTEPRMTFAAEIDSLGEQPTPTATITKSRENVEGLANDGSLATPIEIEVSCEGADRIEIHHFGKVLATADQDHATLTIETKQLGGGPLYFRPNAFFGEKRVQGKILIDQPY